MLTETIKLKLSRLSYMFESVKTVRWRCVRATEDSGAVMGGSLNYQKVRQTTVNINAQ